MRDEAEEERQAEDVRREYAGLLARLNRVLYDRDPAGRRSSACPPDEYRPQAMRILARLRGQDSPEEVQRVMFGVFEEMFSMDVDASPEARRALSLATEDVLRLLSGEEEEGQ